MNSDIEAVAGRLERAADRMIDTGDSTGGVQALLMAQRIRDEAESVPEATAMEQTFHATGRADQYQRPNRRGQFNPWGATYSPWMDRYGAFADPYGFAVFPTWDMGWQAMNDPDGPGEITFAEAVQSYLPSDPVAAERVMEQIEVDSGHSRYDTMDQFTGDQIDAVRADLDAESASEAVMADATANEFGGDNS